MPVIISPLISQAGKVPGTFKENIRIFFIENIDFALHTFELKIPRIGLIKVMKPSFSGFIPVKMHGHDGIVVWGFVTSNFEENPFSIRCLKFGNSPLSSKSWMLSKQPPSIPRIRFLIKKHQLFEYYQSYYNLK